MVVNKIQSTSFITFLLKYTAEASKNIITRKQAKFCVCVGGGGTQWKIEEGNSSEVK